MEKKKTNIVDAVSKEDEISILTEFMNSDDNSIAEIASQIGDSAARLTRVLDGTEPLGRTAYLALLAIKHGLDPISGDD